MKKSRLLFAIPALVIFSITFSSCEKLFNRAPDIENQSFSVYENSSDGTVIGKIVVDDKSGQMETFTIINGNDDEIIALDQKTGIITVNNPFFLNYEAIGSIELQIEVEDEFGKSDYCEIIILVKNVPEIENEIFSINENSASGTLAGKISTPDQDLTFEITSGNINDAFSILNDGSIAVKTGTAIDYETTPSFNLSVTATNRESKSESAIITINLIDLKPTTDGLILYMPFDGNLNDLSSTANNGIDYTMGTYINGKYGQAKEFNGTSDFIKLNRTLNTSAGLSFSFWVNTYGAIGNENNGAIISKYDMAGSNRCLLICSFGTNDKRSVNRINTIFYCSDFSMNTYHDHTMSYLDAADLSEYSNPSLWTIINPKKLTINSWGHCVVNLTSTNIEIWLDGVLCTMKTREYQTYGNTSIPTYIGNIPNGGAGSNNHFHGSLDEFRVYDRSLTAAEINSLFSER